MPRCAVPPLRRPSSAQLDCAVELLARLVKVLAARGGSDIGPGWRGALQSIPVIVRQTRCRRCCTRCAPAAATPSAHSKPLPRSTMGDSRCITTAAVFPTPSPTRACSCWRPGPMSTVRVEIHACQLTCRSAGLRRRRQVFSPVVRACKEGLAFYTRSDAAAAPEFVALLGQWCGGLDGDTCLTAQAGSGTPASTRSTAEQRDAAVRRCTCSRASRAASMVRDGRPGAADALLTAASTHAALQPSIRLHCVALAKYTAAALQQCETTHLLMPLTQHSKHVAMLGVLQERYAALVKTAAPDVWKAGACRAGIASHAAGVHADRHSARRGAAAEQRKPLCRSDRLDPFHIIAQPHRLAAIHHRPSRRAASHQHTQPRARLTMR